MMKFTTVLYQMVLLFCLGMGLFYSPPAHAIEYIVGTGSTNNSNSGTVPFSTLYHDNRTQYLFLASDLTSAGVPAGNINSLAFNPHCS